jgi:hypothetical protein
MQSDEKLPIFRPCCTAPCRYRHVFYRLANILSNGFVMAKPLTQCHSGLPPLLFDHRALARPWSRVLMRTRQPMV